VQLEYKAEFDRIVLNDYYEEIIKFVINSLNRIVFE